MTKKRNEWLDWIKALIVAAILAIVIRVFLFAPIVVDGPSMLPTLENGDHMIVNKFSYTIGKPERFDIVVFHATETKDYIKRVIGLPGDHIEYRDDTLYVNGEPVEETYLQERLDRLSENQSYTFDFRLQDIKGNYETIPEDHVLVLGDNRNNSTDSRMLGLIPLDRIVGETRFIYWPMERFGFVD
ncbi:signal peptidase I [Pontibacillus chungwhensis BH030062]|uniref:Signal peptidase I n=1 Tax=Pontibacillus chungwhensis BH030062 TaxID=1385513 RepID=A0A0A2V253_9BACI|nr:signal peptidase I [Pontibacillus chungwhensis]KGP92841.1 signal peptidase I [Pontibacillus chungwhensis BH030062]